MDEIKLPEIFIGELCIRVEQINGHGASHATLTARKKQRSGSLGKCVASSETVPQQELVRFALELLALSEQMTHAGAFGASDLFQADHGHARRAHRECRTRRYFQITNRLPILQLAQRVLERCDDTTASTLLHLLANADATGKIPVRTRVEVSSVPPIAQGTH
jgi:hypothetical protein